MYGAAVNCLEKRKLADQSDLPVILRDFYPKRISHLGEVSKRCDYTIAAVMIAIL